MLIYMVNILFRGTENKINKILKCSVCSREQPVPEHHGNPMMWVLEGSLRKKELLKCENCGYFMEIPSHCGLTMLYSEEEDANA
jgi:DNA-directed RNA polymerase subunit RPC12/RpoP